MLKRERLSGYYKTKLVQKTRWAQLLINRYQWLWFCTSISSVAQRGTSFEPTPLGSPSTCSDVHAESFVELGWSYQQELSRRSYWLEARSKAWDLIWEAGPYFKRIARDIEAAQHFVIFVGWQVDSRLELTTYRHETFRDFVIRLCNQKPQLHIYFLMWDYAYFFAFERELLQGWIWEGLHERIHFVFDNRHPYGGSHHEKLVIIDGKKAFVGGVDICDDRWDSPEHLYIDQRRSLDHSNEKFNPYHDLSVAVEGPLVQYLMDHVRERWRALSTIAFPSRPFEHPPSIQRWQFEPGKYRVLISRTRAYIDCVPRSLIRENEVLFRDLIRSTRRQLVIENQYYWSRFINDELIRLMHQRAHTGLRIFLVLPSPYAKSFAFRMMGTLQTELVEVLQRTAKQTGTRLVLGCPFSKSSQGSSEKSIYVHSKILAVDDRYLCVGSCNFNNRGFRLDSELTLTLVGDAPHVRAVIKNQVQQLVCHWGAAAAQSFFSVPLSVSEKSSSHCVYLKPYQDSWEKYLRSKEARLAYRLPLEAMFDPLVPSGYFLKRRLAAANQKLLERSIPCSLWGSFLFTLALSLLLSGFMARNMNLELEMELLVWGLVYAIVLSASWLFPIPTVWISMVSGLHLGSLLSTILVGSHLLVANWVGYALGRIFPGILRSFHQRALSYFPAMVGTRQLKTLVRVMFHPHIPFSFKTSYQGIFSIPVRWFVMTSAILVVFHMALAYVAGMFGLEF